MLTIRFDGLRRLARWPLLLIQRSTASRTSCIGFAMGRIESAAVMQ